MNTTPSPDFEPIDPHRARNVMFTLIEARFATATAADLEQVHTRLSGLIGGLDEDISAAAWHTLMAITELVFVEAQLRLEHVDAELRRIIDRRT